ncbi:MFS transporter [Candidatus Micrarchaeota archaeon]|nr:MFS transporter [Candidatus Micrarchaeota archaeon]
MKKLAALNFLDSFIYAGFQLILPLLLVARGIDLVTIGFVFAAMPLVFLTVRLLFASLADQTGVKNFFYANGFFSALSSMLYLTASSPLLFAFGKIAEGAKSSSFWAVNRTAVVQESSAHAEKNAALLSGVRAFALSTGMIVSGIVIAVYSFEAALYAMLAVSTATILTTSFFKSKQATQKLSLSKTLEQLDARKKRRAFWLAAASNAIFDAPVYNIMPFMLTLFMKMQLLFSYEKIGLLLAAYYAVQALATFIAVKTRANPKTLALLFAIIYIPSTALMAFVDGNAFILLFLVASFACGLGAKTFETIIMQNTKNSKTISVDIGLFHIPSRLYEFLFFALAGIAITSLGFTPIFALATASATTYAIFSTRILK